MGFAAKFGVREGGLGGVAIVMPKFDVSRAHLLSGRALFPFCLRTVGPMPSLVIPTPGVQTAVRYFGDQGTEYQDTDFEALMAWSRV